MPFDCAGCRKELAPSDDGFARNARCDGCGALLRVPETVPIRHASQHMKSDYEDLRQLLENADRTELDREVFSVVGLHLADSGQIRTIADGEPVNPKQAHVSIQEHPVAQRRLYQISMRIWR